MFCFKVPFNLSSLNGCSEVCKLLAVDKRYFPGKFASLHKQSVPMVGVLDATLYNKVKCDRLEDFSVYCGFHHQ